MELTELRRLLGATIPEASPHDAKPADEFDRWHLAGEVEHGDESA